MTENQREIADLLHDLGRPVDIIAINAELPIEVVRAWLKSGRWPVVDRQGTLFNGAGASPRETTKPATSLRSGHGLRLFASDSAGRPDTYLHSSARGPTR